MALSFNSQLGENLCCVPAYRTVKILNLSYIIPEIMFGKWKHFSASARVREWNELLSKANRQSGAAPDEFSELSSPETFFLFLFESIIISWATLSEIKNLFYSLIPCDIQHTCSPPFYCILATCCCCLRLVERDVHPTAAAAHDLRQIVFIRWNFLRRNSQFTLKNKHHHRRRRVAVKGSCKTCDKFINSVQRARHDILQVAVCRARALLWLKLSRSTWLWFSSVCGGWNLNINFI